MKTLVRRTSRRIVGAVLGRLGRPRRLSPAQRSLLLEDLREDLGAMVDDAENRGATEKAAREMLAVRDLVGWLGGGSSPTDAEAIAYLEQTVEALPEGPGEGELALRKTYLGAIDELGGGYGPGSRPRREPRSDPGGIAGRLGRRVGELMDERGVGIGGLARRSGIDTLTLVALLFGLERMDGEELIRLSGALGVSSDDLVPGGPQTDPEGGDVR